MEAIPSTMSRYFEPFLGGGAVFFSISDRIPALVNDKSSDLIEFYQRIRNQEEKFFSCLEEMQVVWQALEQFTIENGDSILEIYDRYEGGDASRECLKEEIAKFLQKRHRILISKIGESLNYDQRLFLLERVRKLI